MLYRWRWNRIDLDQLYDIPVTWHCSSCGVVHQPTSFPPCIARQLQQQEREKSNGVESIFSVGCCRKYSDVFPSRTRASRFIEWRSVKVHLHTITRPKTGILKECRARRMPAGISIECLRPNRGGGGEIREERGGGQTGVGAAGQVG